MPSPDSRWEHDEDLRRYGMDPDPWYADSEDVATMARRLFWRRYAEAMIDPSGSYGENSDEEDGEA